MTHRVPRACSACAGAPPRATVRTRRLHRSHVGGGASPTPSPVVSIHFTVQLAPPHPTPPLPPPPKRMRRLLLPLACALATTSAITLSQCTSKGGVTNAGVCYFQHYTSSTNAGTQCPTGSALASPASNDELWFIALTYCTTHATSSQQKTMALGYGVAYAARTGNIRGITNAAGAAVAGTGVTVASLLHGLPTAGTRFTKTCLALKTNHASQTSACSRCIQNYFGKELAAVEWCQTQRTCSPAIVLLGDVDCGVPKLKCCGAVITP